MNNEITYKEILEDLLLKIEMMPTLMLGDSEDCAQNRLEEIGHDLLEILNDVGDKIAKLDPSFFQKTQGLKVMQEVIAKMLSN